MQPMEQFARFGVHLLEVCFFLGAAGSVAVVLFSFVSDVKDLLPSNEGEDA